MRKKVQEAIDKNLKNINIALPKEREEAERAALKREQREDNVKDIEKEIKEGKVKISDARTAVQDRKDEKDMSQRVFDVESEKLAKLDADWKAGKGGVTEEDVRAQAKREFEAADELRRSTEKLDDATKHLSKTEKDQKEAVKQLGKQKALLEKAKKKEEKEKQDVRNLEAKKQVMSRLQGKTGETRREEIFNIGKEFNAFQKQGETIIADLDKKISEEKDPDKKKELEEKKAKTEKFLKQGKTAQEGAWNAIPWKEMGYSPDVKRKAREATIFDPNMGFHQATDAGSGGGAGWVPMDLPGATTPDGQVIGGATPTPTTPPPTHFVSTAAPPAPHAAMPTGDGGGGSTPGTAPAKPTAYDINGNPLNPDGTPVFGGTQIAAPGNNLGGPTPPAPTPKDDEKARQAILTAKRPDGEERRGFKGLVKCCWKIADAIEGLGTGLIGAFPKFPTKLDASNFRIEGGRTGPVAPPTATPTPTTRPPGQAGPVGPQGTTGTTGTSSAAPRLSSSSTGISAGYVGTTGLEAGGTYEEWKAKIDNKANKHAKDKEKYIDVMKAREQSRGYFTTGRTDFAAAQSFAGGGAAAGVRGTSGLGYDQIMRVATAEEGRGATEQKRHKADEKLTRTNIIEKEIEASLARDRALGQGTGAKAEEARKSFEARLPELAKARKAQGEALRESMLLNTPEVARQIKMEDQLGGTMGGAQFVSGPKGRTNQPMASGVYRDGTMSNILKVPGDAPDTDYSMGGVDATFMEDRSHLIDQGIDGPQKDEVFDASARGTTIAGTRVPSWLSSPGGGAGGSVQVLDDIKDCLCNDMSAWTNKETPRSAATGIFAATQPYDTKLEQPIANLVEDGVNPTNIQSEMLLGQRNECPADFTRTNQECAQATDIERSKAETKGHDSEIGAKLDALVIAFNKIDTLPEAIATAVRDAIEGALGNLATTTEPAAGEETEPVTTTGETTVNTTGNMTLAWGDTLTVEHLVPATTPPDLAAQITEIVNNILRDSGLLQGHGAPIREGGISPTSRG
jgi:hypothetical protein